MSRLFSLVLMLALAGCIGPQAIKKPDLSHIRVGDSFTNTTVPRPPSKVETVKTGKHKGAAMLAYEWDLPGDQILNRMYSYVVVRSKKKTGAMTVEAVYEDPVDKYLRDPRAAKLAIEDSKAERAYARNWRLRSLHNPSPRPHFNPAAFGAGLAAAGAAMGAALASGGNYYPPPIVPVYQQPARFYGGGGPASIQQIGYAASRPTATTVIRSGNMVYGSDGTSTTRSGNMYYHSDGTSTMRSGNTFYNSGGGSTTRMGNNYLHSDGSSTTRIGNTFINSDGSSTTVLGR